MNKEFELDENGDVKDKTTFGDVMRVLGKVSYQKPKPKEPFTPKHGVLFVDILEDGCYDCPCCDNEQCYCTALPGGPECFSDRLPECPIKEITITPEVFAERMKEIYREEVDERDDGETAKLRMLKLMYEILCNFGYEEGVDIFRKTPWY